MTQFDEYVCEYVNSHSITDAICMLTIHADYVNFSKYNHSIKRLKEDDKKIAHITAIIKFLRLCQSECEFISDFKSVYFGG